MQASTRRRQLRAASNYRVPRGNAPAMADPPESCRPTGIRPAVRPTTRPRCFPSHRWFQRQLNTRLSRRRCSGEGKGGEITDVFVFSRPDSMSHAIPFLSPSSSLCISRLVSPLLSLLGISRRNSFSLSISLLSSKEMATSLARRLKINAVRALGKLKFSLGLNAEFDKCAPFSREDIKYIYI